MATTLNTAIVSAFDALQGFANQDNFWDLFETAFGQDYDRSRAAGLREQWQAGEGIELPEIQVVADEVLGVAQGAYGLETNTIYLRESFVATASQDSLVRVLLEEYGHFVDAQVNTSDSSGDEGAIFEALVQGKVLDEGILQVLKLEDDSTLITIDGETINVEQATVTRPSDLRIATVLAGYKWGVSTITYSFFSGGSYYGSERGTVPVSDAVKKSVRDFLENTIESLINVNFVEVSDSASNYGLIRYLAAQDPDYAYAYYPTSADFNQGNSSDNDCRKFSFC